MRDIFANIWKDLIGFYNAYSEFVHSILPGGLGDYIIALIDLGVVVLIVWMIARVAFKTKN